MSIAATANSNYTALFSSAGTATSTASGGRAAIIAEIVARILQPSTNSTNSAPPAGSSAAIILTQLLSSTQSVGSTNGAVPMDLNLNQLLNSSMLQKAIAQLPPELLAKPQVIEALVLQNTLLPATANAAGSRERPTLPLLILPAPAGNQTSAQNANTLYRINIQWQNRLIQLLSPQPLPTGTRVPLQIDARGAITLLPPEIAAKILLAQNNSVRAAAQQPVQPSLPLASAPSGPAQTIQQTLRELLPRQQALHTLVPLLQKFITPSVREQLPQPIFKALAQLLQSLPKPAQLHSAESVKTAINNSGSFLEAKLAQVVTAKSSAEPLPKIAATDIKAQIGSLLALIRDAAPTATAPATISTTTVTTTTTKSATTATANPAATAANLTTALPQAATVAADDPITALANALNAAATTTATPKPTSPAAAALVTEKMIAEEEFVYTKPSVQNSPGNTAPINASESLDVLLTQLSKLLQAGFARIQLNQLDSASARHVTPETQTPVPTWVLELPLRTPHGVDQLQLRIEQRRQQQQQQTRLQWNVEIAFDLHEAGKLAASLAIIGKSVSATLWAEREQTHQRVREEMAYLRAGLESVGVNVTEMQCRLGLPAPRSNPISQQLVDVHT